MRLSKPNSLTPVAAVAVLLLSQSSCRRNTIDQPVPASKTQQTGKPTDQGGQDTIKPGDSSPTPSLRTDGYCSLRDEGSKEFKNPFILTDEWDKYGIGDPYLLKHRGQFYLYVSTRDDQTGVKCYSSPDLANWKYQGLCSTDPVTKAAYAPEVVYWNGDFYMYTSPAGRGHYILKSSSPTGPFVKVSENLGYSIDGSIFIDDDAKWYFLYASDDGIMGAPMKSPTEIGQGVRLNARLDGWTEGPTMVKRNGRYQLTYTGNHVISKGYRVSVSSNTTGPLSSFTTAAWNPLLVSTERDLVGLGHSSVFVGPDLDSWYITYHNLAGDFGVGPFRHLNFDRIAWNGEQLRVLGPTVTAQPRPSMPHFCDDFSKSDSSKEWKQTGEGAWKVEAGSLVQSTKSMNGKALSISNEKTLDDFTAEYNLSETEAVDGGSIGIVAGYRDDNNYFWLAFKSRTNEMSSYLRENGKDRLLGTVPVFAGFRADAWHQVRLEKRGAQLKVFVDGLLKQTLTPTTSFTGGVGYFTEKSTGKFSYVAFSDYTNGDSIFAVAKPVPGRIEAVHFLAGAEGTNATEKKGLDNSYRKEALAIRSRGDGVVVDNAAGEWLRYRINVAEDGDYGSAVRYGSAAAVKIRLTLDDGSSVEATLAASGGKDMFSSQSIPNLKMKKGIQTIKVDVLEGALSLEALEFFKAGTVADFTDNFASDASWWTYKDGPWSITASEARVTGTGKRLVSMPGSANYDVTVEIKGGADINAGLLVRAKNPALGGAGNNAELGSNFVQGYFVGISSNSLVLGKMNFSWAELARANRSFPADAWHKVRVQVQDNRIRVYVAGEANPLIDYKDAAPFLAGGIGLRSHGAAAQYRNLDFKNSP